MDWNPIPKDLAAEVLSAEAFNSLNESAPRLVRAAAEGLGVSLGAIRQMAAEGRITSAVLVDALQGRPAGTPAEASARLAEIDAKFARSGDLAGFLHEVGAAGLTLADLASWLATADTGGIPKFSVGWKAPRSMQGVPSASALGGGNFGGGSCGGGPSPSSDPLSEALALGREIVRLNTQMARLLDRWDSEGLPRHRGEV